MKPKDHVMFCYPNIENKHQILFTYLQAGLVQGEAAAYATCESLEDIKDSMRRFGIDIDKFEGSGALHIMVAEDWYIPGNSFSLQRIKTHWKRLYDKSTRKGFKGLRVAGDMTGFFQNGLVNELIEYEKSLHKILDLPITAICAYDYVYMKKRLSNLLIELFDAHAHVILIGSRDGVIAS